MSKAAMKSAIQAALTSELGQGDTGTAPAQIERLSESIANAVSIYVQAELNVLSAQLKIPGAFTVTVPPGVPSPTTPAGIVGYTPGIP